MEKLSNYCHSFLIISCLFVLFSCQPEIDYYQKEFTKEEKTAIADQLLTGLSRYYQGSVPRRFLIEESAKLNPYSADVHRELGVPYLKRGLPVQYEKHYSDAVKYGAVDWQGWRGYIYLYFYRDYERALADFTALDTLTPNFVDYPQSTSVLYMSAICHLKLGNYDQALSFFDQHIEEELRTSTEDFIDAKTFLFQGICHYEKGDKQKAKASFDRGLKNLPENADLWFWMAKLARENGDSQAALAAIQKAKVQFEKEYHNHRPYVEEFYQIHLSDITALQESLSKG